MPRHEGGTITVAAVNARMLPHHVPAITASARATAANIPATMVSVPATMANVPATTVSVPATMAATSNPGHPIRVITGLITTVRTTTVRTIRAIRARIIPETIAPATTVREMIVRVGPAVPADLRMAGRPITTGLRPDIMARCVRICRRHVRGIVPRLRRRGVRRPGGVLSSLFWEWLWERRSICRSMR